MFSIIITLPYVTALKILPDVNGNFQCLEIWPNGLQLVYGSFMNITQFVIPFVTIVICYTRIMIKLRQRCIERSESMTSNQIQLQEEAARTRRMNKMLISIAVIFAICWFPINIFNLVLDILWELLGEDPFRWDWESYYLSLTFLIIHIIAMSSTCHNLFLYGWLNTAFRVEFVKLCPVCVPAQREDLASVEAGVVKLGPGGSRWRMEDADVTHCIVV